MRSKYINTYMNDRHLFSCTHLQVEPYSRSQLTPLAGVVVLWGLEENSNEGLIEPIGSDRLVTDSISLPSQQTSASVTRQLKPANRILRWFDLPTGQLLTVPRRPQVNRERRVSAKHMNLLTSRRIKESGFKKAVSDTRLIDSA